ncbi:hypothetical protein ANCCEY_14887 [Ancylostoma ceylanicum]|uniref:SXP/RAL-2 family protein Ani s 5-like cation-binding domain-containing protein n=2 Tax=Ancylostoma ceylanicum TaxID=53326 RepID=A0A0D6L8R2_9BILA|nr:hypothetical protein ANCCEY_14887 [Ancylostoma ceylanicum]EYC06990.1 hypothetical protein Y032_0072g636 [Ancylostoma ceylanicum]
MCIRAASIAILVVALFLPSQSERIHTIAKAIPRPFLDKVSEDAKTEFWNVAKDKNLTVKQVREKQVEWAKKYGVKDQLENFYKEFEAHSKVVDKEVLRFLVSLPRLYLAYMNIADDSRTLNDILTRRKELVGKNTKEYTVILHTLKEYMKM